MRSLKTLLALISMTLVLSCGGGGGLDFFVSQLTFTIGGVEKADGLYKATATNVTARVALREAAETVTLEKVSSSDADDADLVADLGAMYDDGDATTHGDDIAGDNVYSAIIAMEEATAGTVYLRTNVDTGTYSDIQPMIVMEPLTTAEWTKVLSAPDTIKAQYDANGGTDAENAAAALAYINANLSTLGIATADISDDGQGIWFVYESGILGGFVFNEDDAATSTAIASGTTAPPDSDTATGAVAYKGGRGDGQMTIRTTNGISKWRPLEMFPNPASGLYSFSKSASVDENAIGSKTAILLSPYYHQFRGNDDYWGAWQPIKNSVCPKFDLTAKYNISSGDQNITPEDFKNLSDYGVVVISTHGDNWYHGIATWWEDYFGATCNSDPKKCNWLADAFSQVVLLTGYRATDANKLTYETDLQQHRLMVSLGGSLGVLPSFITKYNGTFPDSMIWLGACRSMYNNTMANAFINKGAKSVVGFDDYVASSYCKNIGSALFGETDGMLELSPDPVKLSDAFTYATDTHGTDDGKGADFLKTGSNDTNFNAAAITNGGFEEGSAVGWSAVGDYRVRTTLGDVSPRGGNYMGVISTGLGTYTGEGYSSGGVESALYQSMCIPAGVDTITFEYDFITEEAMCWVGSAYDDTFTATLRSPDDSSVLATAVTETVNSSTWEFLGGDYFSGGDDASNLELCPTDSTDEESYGHSDGTYHVGWESGSFDVSAYAGQDDPVQIYFYVTDEGDSVWDSAATIDNVELN